jgi:hypothetical protein
VERLGLDPGKREKVAGYVHRTETGLLDPKRVDPRIWEVWGEVVRARVADVLALRPRLARSAPAPVYQRADAAMADVGVARSVEPVEQPDEIDTLFLGS